MDDLDHLHREMDAAVAALDFERAARLRDQISIARGQDGAQARAADVSGLARQQPGAMGLGTSQQRMTPPPGWTPPTKPDPMTRGRSRTRRKPG